MRKNADQDNSKHRDTFYSVGVGCVSVYCMSEWKAQGKAGYEKTNKKNKKQNLVSHVSLKTHGLPNSILLYMLL